MTREKLLAKTIQSELQIYGDYITHTINNDYMLELLCGTNADMISSTMIDDIEKHGLKLRHVTADIRGKPVIRFNFI